MTDKGKACWHCGQHLPSGILGLPNLLRQIARSMDEGVYEDYSFNLHWVEKEAEPYVAPNGSIWAQKQLTKFQIGTLVLVRKDKDVPVPTFRGQIDEEDKE